MDLLVPIVIAIVFGLGFRLGWQIYRSRRARDHLAGSSINHAQTGSELDRRDLRKPIPIGHQLLIQGPDLAVVGESNYRETIERIVGRQAGGHTAITNATLVAEPANPYDVNAIAVQVDSRTVGYLSRADAVRYKPVMDWARQQGFIPCVRADIKGGWRQDDGSWADFGVRLYVASPETLLGQK